MKKYGRPILMKLNGAWKLYYEPEHKGMCLTPDGIGDMPCIEAQVPGNVEMDLVRAGLEEDRGPCALCG